MSSAQFPGERPRVCRFNGGMWVAVSEFWTELLGLNLRASELGFRQIACRAGIVFAFGVTLARLAARRMLGHNAGFDIVLLVILGSVLSRAINGDASFFPALGAAALMVGLHYVASVLAFRCHAFSKLLKGSPHVLVRRGQVDEAELGRVKITPDDLDEHLRLNGSVTDPAHVLEARLERNGMVSVVPAAKEPAGDADLSNPRPSTGAAARAAPGQAGGADRSTPPRS